MTADERYALCVEMRANKVPWKDIAAHLNKLGLRTATGEEWTNTKLTTACYRQQQSKLKKPKRKHVMEEISKSPNQMLKENPNDRLALADLANRNRYRRGEINIWEIKKLNDAYRNRKSGVE